MYDDSYIEMIKSYAEWIYMYNRQMAHCQENDLQPTLFDQEDLSGNNPEHYASIYGQGDCLKFLIQ